MGALRTKDVQTGDAAGCVTLLSAALGGKTQDTTLPHKKLNI